MSIECQLRARDGTLKAESKDGNFLFGPPMIHMAKTCGAAGHRVVWGPACRVMKRKPKGRENVHIECKTCGDYIEQRK